MIIFKHPKILDCYGPGGSAGGDAGTGSSAGSGPIGGGGGPGDGNPGMTGGMSSGSSPGSGSFGGQDGLAGGSGDFGGGLSSTGDPALDANIDIALNDFFGDLDVLADPESSFFDKTKAKFNINYRADFSDQINYSKLLSDVAKPLTLGGMLAGFAPAVTLGLVSKAASTVMGKFQSNPDAAALAGLPTGSQPASSQSTTTSRAQPIAQSSSQISSETNPDHAPPSSMTKEGFKQRHSPKSFDYQKTYSGSVDPKASVPDLVGFESQDAAWEASIAKIKSYLKTPTYKELYS